MTDTKTVQLRLTPDAIAALDAARKRGYTKGGYASAMIVQAALKDGLVPRNNTQPKGEGDER